MINLFNKTHDFIKNDKFVNPPTPWGVQACGISLPPPIVLPLDPRKPHLAPPPPPGETYSDHSGHRKLGVHFWSSFWYRFDTEKSVKMERQKHGLDIASDTRETLWRVHWFGHVFAAFYVNFDSHFGYPKYVPLANLSHQGGSPPLPGGGEGVGGMA